MWVLYQILLMNFIMTFVEDSVVFSLTASAHSISSMMQCLVLKVF